MCNIENREIITEKIPKNKDIDLNIDILLFG